ncbi:Citrinin biosynthesis cluster MFS transporter mrr1 [Xylographa pallens]|nr:Citrinin biosynthesis cluster MFS transporter mrr1 [Xylographa pallens]
MAAITGRRTPTGSEMVQPHGVRDSDATLHESDIGLFEDKLWLSNSIYHFRLFGDDDKTLNMEKDEEQQLGSPRATQEKEDPNLVTWDGPDDPGNPMNWPLRKKILVTFTFSMTTFVITFSSSVFSTATQVTALEFGVSEEVMTLGTSLFVLGFAIGPLIWGPFSELYGRTIPLFTGYIIMGILQIPVAVATNVETIMITRFLGGVFGCAPLAIVGGALADFWGPVDRGVAVAMFAAATFIGPVAGPIMGEFITQSHLGWRWTQWITLIMVTLFTALGLLIIPESFAPVILQRRAKKLRFETRNWAVHAALDENRVDVRQLLTKYLLRPFAMLFLEPILLLITIYMATIYAILYLFFETYPISFQQQRGWTPGVAALPFLGITVGVLLGVLVITVVTKTRFARKLQQHGKVIPEERLPPMILGGALLPAGLFWFAWTSSPALPWAPQVLAGVPIGMGILLIFMQGLNYIIDVYLMYANSAIAANTLIRALAGAGFPLFATAMFESLGVAWASSVLGFVTLAMFPVPILFFIYGKRIRALSRYSPTEKMQ